MTSARPARDDSNRFSDRCFRLIPCLADPAKRSALGLKAVLVLLHVLFLGSLFLLDSDFVHKAKQHIWFSAIYLLLFAGTLIQYFYTAGSSPGYVTAAMIAEQDVSSSSTAINFSRNSIQSAARTSSLSPSGGANLLGRNSRMSDSSWLKMVMDLYPPGSLSRSWTCTYCNIIQPPRSKHCHDCDRCILKFDHHCIWLGTCIGKGNHCRFWWYIFEETILCIWTGILYITSLWSTAIKEWWTIFFAVILLTGLVFCFVFLLLLLLFHCYLVLTNQTTYELVRRRRILYLRGIPQRVKPFSNGICKNIYNFCCSHDSIYKMEAVPTFEELETRARPYTCLDMISCRCC